MCGAGESSVRIDPVYSAHKTQTVISDLILTPASSQIRAGPKLSSRSCQTETDWLSVRVELEAHGSQQRSSGGSSTTSIQKVMSTVMCTRIRYLTEVQLYKFCMRIDIRGVRY